MIGIILISVSVTLPDLQTEHNRISSILRRYDVSPANDLRMLARSQIEGNMLRGDVEEFDAFGRNFKQRLVAYGFDPGLRPFDEFYFRSYGPLSEFAFWEVHSVIRERNLHHYGLAVGYANGYYYYVITLSNYSIYI